MENQNTYNGWTNYATWRVNLECFDGWDIDSTFSRDEWLEIINEKISNALTKSGDIVDEEVSINERLFWFKTEMVCYIADYLKALPEEWASDVKDPTLQGWLFAWLGDVNWREIAEHHLDVNADYKQALLNIEQGAEELA